jgi:glycosyltransferase involved in cell wall biosynthesis
LIRVAEILTRRHPEVIFIFCGSGVARFVAKESEGGILDGKILGVDHVDGVEGILNAMDAFYFPSLNEGMPNALIEAMGIGLPFVASNVPAIQEVVPAELHTYLVSPDDSNSAVRLLESFIAAPSSFPSEKMVDWVRDRFCQDSLYERFSNELISQS